MHMRMAHHPLDPELVRMPEPEEWAEAMRYADDQAITWWDMNPVFATAEEAASYAEQAPVETEMAEVVFTKENRVGEDGWFDSFRSPYWFHVLYGDA